MPRYQTINNRKLYVIPEELEIKQQGEVTKIDLHEIIQQGNNSQLSVVINADKSLLNKQNSLGNTPLHTAMLSSNFKAVKELVTHGADLGQQNARGKTILDICSKKMYRHILEQNNTQNVPTLEVYMWLATNTNDKPSLISQSILKFAKYISTPFNNYNIRTQRCVASRVLSILTVLYINNNTSLIKNILNEVSKTSGEFLLNFIQEKETQDFLSKLIGSSDSTEPDHSSPTNSHATLNKTVDEMLDLLHTALSKNPTILKKPVTEEFNFSKGAKIFS